MTARYSEHVDFVENDVASEPPRHRRVGWVFSEFFLPTQEAHGSMYFTTYPHTNEECPFGDAHAIAWGIDWSKVGGPLRADNYSAVML